MIRVTVTAALCSLALGAQPAEVVEHFEKKVRPVFVKNCQGCHNAKLKSAGLDLSSAAGFAAGGSSGVLVAKDTPENSLLLRVLSYEHQLKMPPTGKLKQEDLTAVTDWVKAGAIWPGANVAVRPPSKPGRAISDEDRNFWAFRPVAKPAVPEVKGTTWIQSPVDAFILQKLEAKGLKPAPPADKAALLRRVTFDLTGLPPTEAEIASFLADNSPKAFEKVVDRLLASPRYGEKWARHWLDVARYADSTGNDEDHRYPYAWRYRDYVIEAFQKDLPYNEFVKQQIAGDLLPAPGGLNRTGIVATGLLALGPKAIAQQDKKKMLYDVYDEQIDVVSRAFLGLTVACARCHDHKFDPILTKDYYALAGIFASTKSFKDPETHVSKLLYTPLVPKEEYEKFTARQKEVSLKEMEIDDLIEQELETFTSKKVPAMAEYMVAARRVYAGNERVEEVAKQHNLDSKLLEAWSKYLTPQGESRVHLQQWEKASAEQAPEVAKAYAKRFETTYAEWTEKMRRWRETFKRMSAEMNMPPPDRPKFDASKDRFFFEVLFEGPLSIPKKEREKTLSAETRQRVEQLRKEHAALKDAMPPEPDMACAVEEATPVEQKVFLRGDYNNLGEPAPKAVPTVLAKADPTLETKGSGRLELANWLASPENPLTARVMVNRIWQWHFGEGIVRTPDNFGKMGERPTHPELLDYLASEFISRGWSVKAMHRMIVLSSAYQMSSTVSDEAFTADPENKLFSRFPQRRLTVEELRDGLLAIDGTLDTTMGGTLQSGFGTDKENSNDRLSLRPETNKRRMVYLPLRRANLPTLLNLFDFGDATSPSGKRALTTVAPQALFMMNSEFIAERSRNISKASLNAATDPGQRVNHLFLRIINRHASAAEKDAALTYVNNFRKRFAEKRSEEDAWFSFTRVLIASNEFLYVD
ncbi:MAG TPA: PSD1 and planctomycete cytochrome C domain-containing protein [Bryobacteraceae bacterium]|nr:PSD1 and planctomycete cytochrome C domain-containing protein [Bryobacteraceae bacterium]